MAFNAFMPGEDNWMRGQPMPGQAPQMGTPAAPAMTGQPQKPRPIMNAFSKIFEIGAPEAFEAGRQKKLTQNLGNALAGGDYSGAAEMALRGGQLEQGLKLRGEAETRQKAQMDEQRKAEAQAVYRVFSSAPDMNQLNNLAMSDPVGFERMAGISADEYLQVGGQLAQMGMTPEQIRQFIVQGAQAELGMAPAGPVEGKVVNNRLVNPITGELMGDFSDAPQPIEVNGVLVDPITYEPIADYRTPSQLGSLTDYQRQQLAMEARRLGISEQELLLKMRQDEAGAGDSYGLNVVWGMDADGNYVPMQAGKSGGLIASQMPEGVTPLGPYGTAFDSASGKAQAEKAALQSTAGKALLGFEAKADELVSQINQAIEMSDFWNTGLTGKAVWSPDFNAILDSIGAKAMLSELVSIKEQGGTFGALSDSEGKALRDAAVNITKSQSEAQLDKNLKAYLDQVEKTRANMRKAFEEEYINNPINRRVPPGSGGVTQPPSNPVGPPVGTVRNGYRFKGGNPNDRNSWEPAQ